MDGIDELADSLRAHRLLQAMVVRRDGTGYELIAGHRRLEAAKQLQWAEIAAVVRDETDDQAYILMLVENLQREDLTPKEGAAALETLIHARGWSTRQVGEALERSPMYVSRRLRVFEGRSWRRGRPGRVVGQHRGGVAPRRSSRAAPARRSGRARALGAPAGPCGTGEV
jgi:ParB-like chromosome segregation protein Spo0J